MCPESRLIRSLYPAHSWLFWRFWWVRYSLERCCWDFLLWLGLADRILRRRYRSQ